jgi:hypothetical protein
MRMRPIAGARILSSNMTPVVLSVMAGSMFIRLPPELIKPV